MKNNSNSKNRNLVGQSLYNSSCLGKSAECCSLTTEEKESQPSKPRQVYNLFINFCENTSLRGIPRIVKATDRRRRLLWSNFVFMFFVGCITCLILIVKQYLQFDVIHQPKTVFEAPRSFPSLTICNLRPFKSSDIERLKAHGAVPVQKYFDSILSIAKSLPRKKASHLTSLFSLESYLMNLPSGLQPEDLGHLRTQLIRSCLVLYRSGTATRGTECYRVGSWIKSQDRVYHNCYTYQVDAEYRKEALSIELVLYLNNIVEDTDCFDCQDRLRGSQLTGARLLLNPDSSYPRIVEEGINLMPGTMTDIRFVVREWAMMTPPYGRCSFEAPEKIDFAGQTYSYSENACQQGKVQELIAGTCKCLSYDRPIPDHLVNTSLPFCQYFQLPVDQISSNSINKLRDTYFREEALEQYVKHMGCSRELTQNTEATQTGCQAPCTRYTYDTLISSAQWPTKRYMTNFAMQLIRDEKRRQSKKAGPQLESNASSFNSPSQPDGFESRFLNLLQPYIDIINLTKMKSEEEAVEKLMALHNIENNFLSIIVSRPNFDIIRVEEKAVVTLTSLFSQIGGLFSIWVGVTMICIVEIAELLLNIFDVLRLPSGPRKQGTIDLSSASPQYSSPMGNSKKDEDD